MEADDAEASETEEQPADASSDSVALAQDAAGVDDEAVADEEWWPSIFGTTEKCCRCKSGTKGWSASGKCSFCRGRVAKKKSVAKACTKKYRHFKGSRACANTCSAAVLVEMEADDAEASETEEQPVDASSDSVALVQDAAGVDDEAVADEEWWPSIFGTTEKCCRCKSGTKGWSASGKCSFCRGRVAK